MDEVRKIRFLYPPIFLAIALLTAIPIEATFKWINEVVESGDAGAGDKVTGEANGESNNGPVELLKAIGLAAFVGLALPASGFVIGTISLLFLRIPVIAGNILARCNCTKATDSGAKSNECVCEGVNRGWAGHETFVESSDCDRVWTTHLGAEKSNAPVFLAENRFALSCAFHHGDSITDGQKQWIERRWNAMNLSLHSAFALLIAIGLVVFYQKTETETGVEAGVKWYVISGGLAAMFAINARLAWSDIKRFTTLLVAAKPQKSENKNDSEAD